MELQEASYADTKPAYHRIRFDRHSSVRQPVTRRQRERRGHYRRTTTAANRPASASVSCRGAQQPRLLRPRRGLQSLHVRRPLLHVSQRLLVLCDAPWWPVGLRRTRAGAATCRRGTSSVLQDPAGPRQAHGTFRTVRSRSWCERMPPWPGEERTLLTGPFVFLGGLLVQLGAPARRRRNLHVAGRDLR